MKIKHTDCDDLDTMDKVLDGELPYWTGKCECGATVEHYRGGGGFGGDEVCDGCGREYNASGDLLRQDWREDYNFSELYLGYPDDPF